MASVSNNSAITYYIKFADYKSYIMITGVMGNVEQIRSNRCIEFPIKSKTGLCVLKDCESFCKKKGKGLEGMCPTFAKQKDPKHCYCCGPWPPL
ncbi:defensin-like protein 147 [Capsella rubella]|uniref:defensin-like protein 147 n=1 Tax=Capsella rubella TaxID=81985 RepID=UPI000CD5C850|nr:defensin-like protein 147 [Capsella rubella]